MMKEVFSVIERAGAGRLLRLLEEADCAFPGCLCFLVLGLYTLANIDRGLQH